MHDTIYSDMNLPSNMPIWAIILETILLIWTFTWKAIALWRSARSSQTIWFTTLFLLLPISLLGIPEIIYLFFYAKKKMTIEEVKKWITKTIARKFKSK